MAVHMARHMPPNREKCPGVGMTVFVAGAAQRLYQRAKRRPLAGGGYVCVLGVYVVQRQAGPTRKGP
jgi:hypothetical protein